MSFQIRDLEIKDIHTCREIVESYWGETIAAQAESELWEMFQSKSKWPPHYYVAVNDNDHVVGFAGFKAAWLMSNVYELIWVNVAVNVQGHGIGKALTERRMKEIGRLGGSLVMLMTKKAPYFEQFGFKSLENIDGWVLMIKQLAPLVIGNRPHG